MRKLLLVALLFTSTAQAENWYRIAETPDNKYTIEVDIDSVNLGVYDRNKPDDGMYVIGISRYIADGKELTKLASAVDVEECLTKSSGAIKTEWPDGKTEMSTWKAAGETAVDHRGKFLCGFVNGSLKGLEKPAQKAQPKKIWM